MLMVIFCEEYGEKYMLPPLLIARVSNFLDEGFKS